jgi:hypothetical protein
MVNGQNIHKLIVDNHQKHGQQSSETMVETHQKTCPSALRGPPVGCFAKAHSEQQTRKNSQ